METWYKVIELYCEVTIGYNPTCVAMSASIAASSACTLGFGRIVVSEKEVPNMLVIMV
jgi:hypothetical protein